MSKSLRRRTPEERSLIDRILDTPHLAQVVPRLQPEVLHRVIQRCGLEDCAELVALATSAQLQRVFDLDLWQSRRPGSDEQLDADRFGVWLGVLMESGVEAAAQTLAAIDTDLVVAALAQHVRVFDRAAAENRIDGPACEIAAYLIEATRTDAWDAIVALLLCLDADHPDAFHRVMRGCRRLSNADFEIDGLHDLLSDREQDLFDLAVDRERRREEQGYVTPAQARAFLQMARQFRPGRDVTPPPNPVAAAYFRAIDWTPPADANADAPAAPRDSSPAMAAVVEMLRDAGVLTPPPRGLLQGAQGEARRLARIQSYMQCVLDRSEEAYAKRTEEFAYLANTIAAGCSVQGRPFTPPEASDAAAAACNLGLENWPGQPLADDFLVDHDLIGVFQVGWTVLHTEVCLYAAEHLIEVLTGLRFDDREIQAGLDALRVELTKSTRAGTPWRAREALDAIVMLDQPAWATLVALIDECPVIHAALGASRSRTRAVGASAFEFISENRQVESVRDFMRSLPDALRA